MNVALIILGHLFTFVAAIAGLLLGLSFTSVEHQRFPVLRKLDGKRVPLLVTTVLSLAIVLVSNVTKDVQAEFEPVPGVPGMQKATESGFEKELKDTADELKAKAKRYFEAGEEDFKPGSYEDAARNYQKSIDLLPTMSAYLNAGLSWYYVSNYPKAEQAFLAGLQLARKKGDEEFEGNFLGNIGNVYANQGKLEEALKSYQQALEIDKQIGNPLGEAAALCNIGSVYFQQGKLEEALKPYQQALEIHKKIGNSLGEAQDLCNIGNVYANQGKLEAALKSYQQSLEIHKQIGNPLGEAQALGNIGLVYEAQGKSEKALQYLKQARDIFEHVGARLQLQGVEYIISTINEQPESAKNR